MYKNTKYGGIYQDKNTKKYYVLTKATSKDGYRLNICKRGFASKNEALAYKLDEVKRIQNSYHIIENNSNATFKDFVEIYLEYYKMKVEVSTFKMTKGIINNHIIPNIPNHKLNDLKPSSFAKFKKVIYNQDSVVPTKNLRLAVLRDIINYAIKKCYIDIPVANQLLLELEPFKSEGYTSNNAYWEISDFKAFLATFEEGSLYYMFFLTLFSTGLRISEIRALQWQDFDYNKRTLSVTKQTTSKLGYGKWIIIPHTKTKKDRVVNIPEDLAIKLQDFKRINKISNEECFLFFGDSPISENSISYQKKMHCKLANVPYIRNHDFRHSYTVYLFDNNIDIKSIANQLGHTSTATTMDTYNHVSKTREEKLNQALNNLKF